jgi:hypothetical protein
LGPYDGSSFLVLGAEPGTIHGIDLVDVAEVHNGVARFLGNAGPKWTLEYVGVDGSNVAVVEVSRGDAGRRPYLCHASYSGDRAEVIDGRVYVRRPGSTSEAAAAEVQAMLEERDAARLASGPLWPMGVADSWQDGDRLYVRQPRGTKLIVLGPDNFTNLVEMSAARPELPSPLPEDLEARLRVFDDLFDQADIDPAQAISDAWPPLRAIAVATFENHVGPLPMEGFKVVDMVERLARKGYLVPRWVDVAYPLYYWPPEQGDQNPIPPGIAKTYVKLARALAAALLLVVPSQAADS